MSAKDTIDFASHVIENKTYIGILFKWRIDALGNTISPICMCYDLFGGSRNIKTVLKRPMILSLYFPVVSKTLQYCVLTQVGSFSKRMTFYLQYHMYISYYRMV